MTMLSPARPPTAPALDADGDDGRFVAQLGGWYCDYQATPDNLCLVCTDAQMAALLTGGVIVPARHALDPRHMHYRFTDWTGTPCASLSLQADRALARAILAAISPTVEDYRVTGYDPRGTWTRAWMTDGAA